MAAFRKYNGKTGYDFICHTATGYRCLARIISLEDMGKKIYFFAKHIVGKDGRPYTEIGFECNESFNKKEFKEKTKNSLINAGFKEIFAISNCEAGEIAFTEYATPYPNSMEFRLWAGKDGVKMAFDALSAFLSSEVIAFVHDQEANVEETLFESLMEAMGDELSKGPGGIEKAHKKARELADYFVNGIRMV